MSINNYNTFVFDCDGVVLNSNHTKTRAFYNVALPYGKKVADSFKQYHIENGGISRYEKFQYFINNILGKESDGVFLEELLDRYSTEVVEGLMNCGIAEGLTESRLKTKGATWLIVSGSDQIELREVFKQRGLEQYFDGGIFGSPGDKDVILAREISRKNISGESLFIGDSVYDFNASKRAGLEFVFISDWTEVEEWEGFCRQNNIVNKESLKKLFYEKN